MLQVYYKAQQLLEPIYNGAWSAPALPVTACRALLAFIETAGQLSLHPLASSLRPQSMNCTDNLGF